jgi:hypothetical protein
MQETTMPTYGFYDETIRQSFLDAISKHKLATSLGERHDELIVTIEGDIEFDTELELDEVYNSLLGDGLDLWASEEEVEGLETNAAGVRVQLASGQFCLVRIDTNLMNKVLGCLTPDELESLVQQIALEVENPSDTPLCER